MNIDKILVVIFSFTGIVFTYWFFLMKKEDKAVVVNKNNVDILVKGGYSPNVVSIPKGKTTTLNFMRQDSSSCLEEVVIPDFKIRKYLPLNKKVSIPITPQKEGEYEISCGMNMFHGKIIVK
ncbi:MAG: copper-binding protein [Candidatus Levybacteria bacterium]|nr:copper-binding protein [Candidatus Levybacteria bacterium]